MAGQEAFIADTAAEAWSLAKTAHPEDDGALCQYVLPNRGPRIAVTDLSILGRDVLNHFDLILSRRRNEVLLLAPNHHYRVDQV